MFEPPERKHPCMSKLRMRERSVDKVPVSIQNPGFLFLVLIEDTHLLFERRDVRETQRREKALRDEIVNPFRLVAKGEKVDGFLAMRT